MLPHGRPQYDNRADDLTKDGMLKGIESSAAFVLFLSTGVLERPYCQMEIRHALALKKPVVLLHGEKSESKRCARTCACAFTSDRRLLFHFRRPCPPRPSGRAESDARYGGFDFRAAHEAAPADLRELLDNTESLPFRRRGYERDGMLK